MVQKAIITLLFALGCYAVVHYGFDAVVKQTMMENEFFHGHRQVSQRPKPVSRLSNGRMTGDN